MIEVKEELLRQCFAYVQSRIDNLSHALRDTKSSSGEETKSSAGDKYETSREMMQQDTNRNMAQLNEANKLLSALKQININRRSASSEPGSLVITKNSRFFISISAGSLTVNGQAYFAVSPASPIGLKLKGCKAGDNLSLNGKQYLVEEVL